MVRFNTTADHSSTKKTVDIGCAYDSKHKITHNNLPGSHVRHRAVQISAQLHCERGSKEVSVVILKYTQRDSVFSSQRAGGQIPPRTGARGDKTQHRGQGQMHRGEGQKVQIVLDLCVTGKLCSEGSVFLVFEGHSLAQSGAQSRIGVNSRSAHCHHTHRHDNIRALAIHPLTTTTGTTTHGVEVVQVLQAVQLGEGCRQGTQLADVIVARTLRFPIEWSVMC